MKALLIIDMQNDFCSGGPLPVQECERTVTVINSLIPEFPIVLASKDWHPQESAHFERWPKHCIQGTIGAEFHPGLKQDRIDQIFLKGTDDKDNGYSAFEATNHNLEEYLSNLDINELYIVGVATEYCVRSTAMDAISKGFNVYVIKEGISGVESNKGDSERALLELETAGAKIVSQDELLATTF